MPGDDLTPVQRSVLLILMAEAREVPNAYLTNDLKLTLKKPARDGLRSRGLITERKHSGRVYLELADQGWRWCREQAGAEVPPRAGHGGVAAYAILAGLQRYLSSHPALALPDLFTREEPPGAGEPAAAGAAAATAVMEPTDLAARIRKAYQNLAAGPGSWVRLADLRPLLGGARPEVDRVLVEMGRMPDVSIVPESDQKSLADRDRAAAVVIGNQHKHLIAIGP
jgi:hypothetical protein